jgi:TPR repeat protein
MYFNGDGVLKDSRKAAELFQKACNGDEATGCRLLKIISDTSRNVLKKPN